MPYFHFDLVIDEQFVAFERAESLASELSVVRPDLRSTGCAVRVTDYENRELCRTPLDPDESRSQYSICPRLPCDTQGRSFGATHRAAAKQTEEGSCFLRRSPSAYRFRNRRPSQARQTRVERDGHGYRFRLALRACRRHR